MKKIKIGLALGSGGPRGFAHIGVLQALEESGIKIDMISGSSIGSVVAAHYSLHGSIKDLGQGMLAQAEINFFKLFNLKINKGLVNQKKIAEALSKIIGSAQFKDTKIPLYVNATNLDNGKNKIFHSGSILNAVQASCSMPFIFEPFKYNSQLFTDGAISDPVPVDILRKSGADFIIAVNLYNSHEFKKQELNAVSTLVKSWGILINNLATEKSKSADYVININLSKQVKAPGLKYLFSKADYLEAIELGHKETKKAIKIIKKVTNKNNAKQK
ncbi:MAG: hypothetical protein EOM88_02545 [Clostridia bacterium]|nr:hypothetical protein [Clostridia bacterium]